MWETIVGGVIVAGISGLVLLAYRNPHEYRIIGSALFLFFMVVGPLYAGFVFGTITAGISRLESGLEIRPDAPISEWSDQVSTMSASVERLKLLGMLLVLIVLVDFALRQLPRMRAVAADSVDASEVTEAPDEKA